MGTAVQHTMIKVVTAVLAQGRLHLPTQQYPQVRILLPDGNTEATTVAGMTAVTGTTDLVKSCCFIFSRLLPPWSAFTGVCLIFAISAALSGSSLIGSYPPLLVRNGLIYYLPQHLLLFIFSWIVRHGVQSVT